MLHASRAPRRRLAHRSLAALPLTACLAAAADADPPRFIIRELPSLGGTVARANTVNNAGLVAGESRRAGENYEVATAWLPPAYQPVYITGSGISVTTADAVNDAGVIVGTSDNMNIAAYRAAPPTAAAAPMPELGTHLGHGMGINARGDVCGAYTGMGLVGWRPFLVRDGALIPLPLLGGLQGEAMAINSAGVAAGWSDGPSGGLPRAVVWSGSSATELLSNPSMNEAHGINDAGWVVGYVSGPPSPRYIAALWTDPQTRIDLGALDPSHWNHMAHGINNRAQVVGHSGTRAFLWENGTMRDLNTLIDPALGWTLRAAYAISDTGLIVGEGVRAGSTQTRAFLLEPRCPADFDGNGAPAPADLAGFVSFWFASIQNGTLGGDFDRSGAVNPGDVAAFVNAWFAALTGGC